MPSSSRDWEAQRVRFSAGSVALVVAALAGTLLARNVLLAAHQPLGWALAALTGALVLGSIVAWYGRFVRYGIAVLLSLLSVVVVVGALLVGLVPELQGEADRLAEVLPDAAAGLERHERFGSLARDVGLADRVDAAVRDLDDRISNRAALEGAMGTAPAFALTGILTVFFLLWGSRMAAGLQRQVSDDEQRERWAAVAAGALAEGRTYILAAVVQGLVLGTLAGVVAWWVDLPAPIALGVCVGLLSLVPFLGVVLGAVPLLLVAAASQPGWRTVLLVLLFVGLQVASAVWARSVVQPRSLRVGPAPIVITALLAFEVYGFGGVAVALALVVFAFALLDAASTVEGHTGPEPAATS